MLRAPAPRQLLGDLGLCMWAWSCIREPCLWAEPQATSGADPAGKWPKPHGLSCPRSLCGTAGGIAPQSGAAQEGTEPSSTRPITIPHCQPGASFPPATSHFCKAPKREALGTRTPFPNPLSPCHSEPGDKQVPLFAGGGGKPKIAARPNSRKAKSPAPGLSSGERPPSVSSVHSEGDCNRRTPLTNRVWEDRPSSAGRAG